MPQISIYIYANSILYVIQLLYSMVFMKFTNEYNLKWQVRINYLIFKFVLIVTIFGIYFIWSRDL